ncbi:MAG: ion transporter [Alphaproteobacteria bacterium]
MSLQSLRLAAYRQLEPAAWPRQGLSPVNLFLAVLIVIAVIAAVIETEPTVSAGREELFGDLELLFASIFLVEYVGRLWTVVDNPRFAGYRSPRLRYAVSPIALIDLAAIVPAFFAFGGASSLILRFFRILRMLRLAKLGRTTRAWGMIRAALHERRHEFGIILILVGLVLLISSSMLYFAEADAQPEKFGSIPRALWWSIITLTTVGYGDVYPVTSLGRFFAAIIALTGVMVIAIPTGIFAASFSEGLQRHREQGQDENGPDA